ncbi:hypothetical protein SCAR479_03170 [Seiridium cardinale]|uniref:DUF7704 domain-containing protein n=1 Tax=Seiridium cardinale TaxID=138064 RepID=A0ABR2Y1U1_9PEZI
MAVTCLPAWPLVLFGVLEPAALIWAYVLGVQDPATFYASQAPNHALKPADFHPQARGVTLTLLNVYLLLAALAVVCTFTTKQTTTRWYLVAVALADLGHIYATYAAVGPGYFWDFAGWSDMIWGNVGVSAFLHGNRWLTVMGAFGALTSGRTAKGKRA